jgi:RNA-directed DNA polymerase
MKRHKQLWPTFCTWDNFELATRRMLKGKRYTKEGARFASRWEDEVCRLLRELEKGEYRPGDYHYFSIHEPKERIVAAAPMRDRVVHHALVQVLEPLFEPRFIEDSFACRKDKGTHAGMRRALEFTRQYPWVVKCDIRRYFPSIDHEFLRAAIKRVVGDRHILELIDLILESHRDRDRQWWPEGGDLFSVQKTGVGIPIGNLTSQFFANIHLDAFDHYVKQDLRVKGYVRYVDDFLIFGESRTEVRGRGNAAKAWLHGIGLEIHPDKYRVCRTAEGVDFCGFRVRADGRIRLRTDSVRRFQRRYREQLWRAKRGELASSDVTRSVQAWIAHAEHAQSWRLREAVLSA